MKRRVLVLALIGLVLLTIYACASSNNDKAEQERWRFISAGTDASANTAVVAEDFSASNVLQEVDEKDTGVLQKKEDNIIALPEYEKKKVGKEVSALNPINIKGLTKTTNSVSINVEGMPLYDFIVYTVGDTLKVPFFLDESIRGVNSPVTLKMAEKLPPDKVFEISVQILRQKGLIVGEKSGSLYILIDKSVNLPPNINIGRTASYTPEKVVQIVPLKYLKAAEIRALIGYIYKLDKQAGSDATKLEPSLAVSTYDAKNSLIIDGPSSSVKDVLSFIDMMDVPYIEGKELFMLTLTYWKPDDFVKQLSTIITGTGINVANTPNEPGVLFIPVNHINSVLVVAPDKGVLDFVASWARRLDTADLVGVEENTYTYTPKFAKASELVSSVESVYGISSGVELKTGQSTKKDPTIETRNATKEPTKSQTKEATNEPVKSTLKTEAEELKITADDRRNVVIVVTTPKKYEDILHLLQEIDTPPKQVLLEAMIAEVSWGDTISYGFAWYLNNEMFNNPFSLSSTSDASIDPFSKLGAEGLLYHLTTNSEKLAIIINHLASDDRLEILSKPSLMVLNNEEATIQIGDEIPTISSEISRTDIQNSVDRNIVYRSTGIILRIRPTINSQGLVTLEIFQEVSDAQKTSTSSIDSPTIIKRRIDTSVVAGNGQTIVLGGLMQKNFSKSDTRVPFLGDIPVLGYLFKTEQKSVDRKELIILITPRILSNVEETTRITDEFRKIFSFPK